MNGRKTCGLHFRTVVHDQLELLLSWIGFVFSGFQLDHLFNARMVFVDNDAGLFIVLSHDVLDHLIELSKEGIASDEHVCLSLRQSLYQEH